jgi:hypothetical protein
VHCDGDEWHVEKFDVGQAGQERNADGYCQDVEIANPATTTAAAAKVS